jgi:hypothetical protein
MKSAVLSLFTGIALLSLVSCKKSSGGSPTSLASQLPGTWKFLYLTAHTQSVAQETAGGSTFKSVTVSDYTTINNAGTIVFTSDNFTTTGLTYEVSTTLYGAEYQDGLFLDSLSSPFDYVIPVSGSSVPYKAVGVDSLYFPAGGIAYTATNPVGVGQQPTGGGSRYTIHGDTLSVVSVAHQSSTQNTPGDIVTTTVDAKETVILIKQ